MMCSVCKKRPAMVFMSSYSSDGRKNEGLCLKCAYERGIPQIDEYMQQMGITPDMLDEICDEMLDDNGDFDPDMFKNPEGMNKLMGALKEEFLKHAGEDDPDEDGDDSGSDEDSFEPGGAGTLPKMFKDLFFKESDGKPEEKSGSESAKGRTKKPEKPDKRRRCLETYCTNLTRRARNGEIDRIIGREKEIYRVMQILSRRTKNNPCLIGEPGVGKTAIAEGIALKLVSDEVPFRLRGKELYLLDLTALVAGTQFRGQFESRVKSLIDEVKSAGNIILFIDEVHTLVGTGDSSEGSMNAANMFKPALSRGELQVIGATTFKEYRKHIEKDSALERRFQPVTVCEPTVEETVELLEGIKDYYEKHHKVKVSSEIARMCAVLSERYINDRFLPDKAIDLLDESCACASLVNEDITEYERLKEQLADYEAQETAESEKAEVDYAKMAELKTHIAQTSDKIALIKDKAENTEVTMDDLSKVIELWTGIPANKIKETEYKRMAGLEEALKAKVIGQDEACELVAKAIKRTRVQLSERRRPASFIFVGPTGVGKTELVKVLAKEMFDSVEPLIRLDMSEYMEKHSVSKIIGAPPGYVGYDEAGQLTERVRRRPYSVVLFDEIEKAHPDVMNILLQILDEGRITDAQGRTVSFENTIIAMTSNAGSGGTSSGIGFNKTDSDVSKERAMKGLRDFLRPEFLARVDEVVVFSPLSKQAYAKIAALVIEELHNPLKEKKIELCINNGVYEAVAEKAYGGKFGGRDIRRVVRTEIEDKIAEAIIEHADTPLGKITLGTNGGEITVTAE